MLSKQEAIAIVASNVRTKKDEKGWSLRQLAKESEVAPMIISRLLNQESMPAGHVCHRIATALGVTLDALFTAQTLDIKPKKRS